MERREFLAASVGCACLLLTKPGMAGTMAAATATTGPVKVGELKSFIREGLDDRFLKNGFFLVRGKDRIYALSAFCTHKTDTRLNGTPGNDKIICPRHSAQYALDGAVIRGPAKLTLSRFVITVDNQGQVTVDTSAIIEPAMADDPRAFIKVV